MRTVPIINNLKIAWSDLLSNVFKGQGQTVGLSSVSAQYPKNTKGFWSAPLLKKNPRVFLRSGADQKPLASEDEEQYAWYEVVPWRYVTINKF